MRISIKTAGPFLLLTFVYFIVGFLTTVNGQCQGPLKVAFLSEVTENNNSLTTLISFSFFLGYLLNSSKTGRMMNRLGYKKTLIRSMMVMVIGVAFYLASALCAEYCSDVTITIGNDKVPIGYFVFLFGSYTMGTSAAMLQVVINPYIAAYPLPGTQAVQRMNFTCAINSIGTTIAPFFVTAVMFSGVPLDRVSASQLTLPFLVMMIVIAFTTWTTSKASLPDIEGTREEVSDKPRRSIWSFRHLRYGVITIFFYVGTEVGVGNNMNLHAMDLMKQGYDLSPALLATLYWGSFLVGRMVSAGLKNVAPRPMLITVTVAAIALMTTSLITENLWLMAAVGLFHSVMWSCIFTLSVDGLKEYTSKASGIFMMGVFGGAVFPVLQGMLADSMGSWQYTWLIPLCCEFVILWYGLIGYRKAAKDQIG
ncbi:MFS transporter [uncultured Prevotella sp.]|uniref:MFS transporter n=1 Tax=uncultured Prevotella sp. TaxID=159272 RepID=UPI002590B803|nr:MFS transporter [uncultured Prevotella sp.]